ncbi:hypothetical protein M569_09048 [Genlisea aurea]|uniref:Uncharacterized protein n=1 Tax=Genlisea aurea TaxID=192259 RepID=S8CFQ1_9LAMI|nr:hypothetical protein M569_09048 [Genlisea aurea]
MVFILPFLLGLLSLDRQSTRIARPIESIYQFGASKSDTGNGVRISPVPLAAGRLPYGETFPGKPTGRFSDGRLIIDETTKALGLPLLDPYQNRNASFKNGANFAVASATALNRTTLLLHGIVPSSAPSLEIQIGWFAEHLRSICSTPSECGDRLRNSLIFFGEIGGNDINYAIDQGKSFDQIRALTPSIVGIVITGIKQVIAMGASRFIVPGNYPIGCFPSVLIHYAATADNSTTLHDENGCVKLANDVALHHNQLLKSALAALSQEHPDVGIEYLNLYDPLLDVIRSPSENGPFRISYVVVVSSLSLYRL